MKDLGMGLLWCVRKLIDNAALHIYLPLAAHRCSWLLPPLQDSVCAKRGTCDADSGPGIKDLLCHTARQSRCLDEPS